MSKINRATIDANINTDITGVKLNAIIDDITESYTNLINESHIIGLKEYDN